MVAILEEGLIYEYVVHFFYTQFVACRILFCRRHISKKPPLTETAFYFMQSSISQAQFYLLVTILFALWSLNEEHHS
jgi:hypothetical protein